MFWHCNNSNHISIIYPLDSIWEKNSTSSKLIFEEKNYLKCDIQLGMWPKSGATSDSRNSNYFSVFSSSSYKTYIMMHDNVNTFCLFVCIVKKLKNNYISQRSCVTPQLSWTTSVIECHTFNNFFLKSVLITWNFFLIYYLGAIWLIYGLN